MEIFASQGAPLVSTTPVANLPPVSTTPVANFDTVSIVVDNDDKFATGFNNTGGKFAVKWQFATGINDTGKFCHQSESQQLPDSPSRRVGF
jgi:hypothetical protein